MGIRFECVHCGHALHVKDFLAGKRGICPHCQGRIEIPNGPGAGSLADDMAATVIEIRDETNPPETTASEGTSVAGVTASQSSGNPSAETLVASGNSHRAAPSDDPIAEAPQLSWYVLPPGSITKFGPAQGELMRTWLREGRVPADAFVWREGWGQWRVASSVFPPLARSDPKLAANRYG